jgi:uncharacterized membrane protein YeaQ/YmgE (transglycosylase-associated protein family)
MRRRLYFLLPAVKHTRSVFNELLLARIEDRRVHVLAREGTDLGDLPEATLWQKSDTIHGIEVGLIAGGATGAVAGVIAMLFPPAGVVMGLWIVLAVSIMGAAVGGWVSGIIGTDVPNTQLKQFYREVEKGKILMMVDVPKDRVAEITRVVKRDTPQADARGMEPTMPAFP